MKKSRLIIISSLIISLVALIALALVISKPVLKTKTSRLAKGDRSGQLSGSLNSYRPGDKFPPEWTPISPENRAKAMARFIAFPQTIAGSGPPNISGDWEGGDPAIGRYATIELLYPNGYYLTREYRHPDDQTIRNNKEIIEAMQKEHATFYGGVTYQLGDINGHEALVTPPIAYDVNTRTPAKGVTIRWYVQPFLYNLYGPVGVPMDKVVAAAQEITEFADKNVPPDLPPYAANTPSGYLFPDETTGTPTAPLEVGPPPSGTHLPDKANNSPGSLP